MSIRFRPRRPNNTVRDPLYSPHRDLAFIGPVLCSRAVESFEEKWREPWFADFLDYRAVTDEELAAAVKALAAALVNITKEGLELDDALEAAGFTELRDPVRIALFVRLGQILLSSIWAAVRDAQAPGSEPPPDIRAMADWAQSIAFSEQGDTDNDK